MKRRSKDRERERAIGIHDVLDTDWFVRLIKSAAKNYDITLSDRGVKVVRRVLRRGLEDPVYDILADTRVFRSVKVRNRR